MLVLRRHPEIREDQDEDEDVVDGERQLDQVAGEELERLGASLRGADDHVEDGHEDDDDVVDGERQLDQITGEELETTGASLRGEDDPVEDRREEDDDGGPSARLLHRNGVRVAVEHAEIHGEHPEDENVEAYPEPDLI